MNKGKFIGYDDECRYLWEFGKCDNICVRDCIDIGYFNMNVFYDFYCLLIGKL